MSEEGAKIVPLRRKARCPICSRPATPEHRPFCSRRCQQIDLGRWAGGTYRVETDEVPTEPADPGSERD